MSTYKFSLVRTIVHVYCFPWPRIQLSFVRTTCTYKGMLVRINSYLVRTIVYVYCFPWPRVKLSKVVPLVRTKECWYVQTVDQNQLYIQALILYVQSRCFCSCKAVVRAIVRAKVFSFYRGADTCTAHFCYGGFSRISGRSVYSEPIAMTSIETYIA